MFYSRCYYILYTSLGFKTVAGLPTFVKCFGEFFLSVHTEKKEQDFPSPACRRSRGQSLEVYMDYVQEYLHAA